MNCTEGSSNAEGRCAEFNFNLALFLTVLFIISLSGNSVAIIVFCRRKFTPAILLFLVLATLDVLFLLSQFLVSTMPILCEDTNICKNYAEAKIYLDAYAFPIVVIIYCISTWVVVLMAFNRYFAIVKPLVYHRVISVRSINIELALLCSLCVAYNIPRFLEYDTETSQNSTSTASGYFSKTEDEQLTALYMNRYYQVYYKILSFLILMIFIPLVLLTYFTAKLIKEIKLSNARRKDLFNGSQFSTTRNNLAMEEQNITITLVTVVIAFILFHFPIGINRILQLIFVYKYGTIECHVINNTTYYVSRVLNSFAEINAALNFIIYGVTSSQFRRDLKNLCNFRKAEPSSIIATKNKTQTGGSKNRTNDKDDFNDITKL